MWGKLKVFIQNHFLRLDNYHFISIYIEYQLSTWYTLLGSRSTKMNQIVIPCQIMLFCNINMKGEQRKWHYYGYISIILLTIHLFLPFTILYSGNLHLKPTWALFLFHFCNLPTHLIPSPLDPFLPNKKKQADGKNPLKQGVLSTLTSPRCQKDKNSTEKPPVRGEEWPIVRNLKVPLGQT